MNYDAVTDFGTPYKRETKIFRTKRYHNGHIYLILYGARNEHTA